MTRINFGEWPINLNLAGRNFGEFGDPLRQFVKIFSLNLVSPFYTGPYYAALDWTELKPPSPKRPFDVLRGKFEFGRLP